MNFYRSTGSQPMAIQNYFFKSTLYLLWAFFVKKEKKISVRLLIPHFPPRYNFLVFHFSLFFSKKIIIYELKIRLSKVSIFELGTSLFCYKLFYPFLLTLNRKIIMDENNETIKICYANCKKSWKSQNFLRFFIFFLFAFG